MISLDFINDIDGFHFGIYSLTFDEVSIGGKYSLIKTNGLKSLKVFINDQNKLVCSSHRNDEFKVNGKRYRGDILIEAQDIVEFEGLTFKTISWNATLAKQSEIDLGLVSKEGELELLKACHKELMTLEAKQNAQK